MMIECFILLAKLTTIVWIIGSIMYDTGHGGQYADSMHDRSFFES
jgi:hypothetical protein